MPDRSRYERSVWSFLRIHCSHRWQEAERDHSFLSGPGAPSLRERLNKRSHDVNSYHSVSLDNDCYRRITTVIVG
ncbi:Hypothetical protein NTJ_15678 [Nesidiocoris tenuis]|uniref:Uncharacterized protein n=1 Tax=Nesidiocoris tenuis TaxID=355587 RepID=A0ABN7BG45_9HEMI|nr:Hypothetical protein NTJ_15678 [Nesidiocoris tenuis]